MASLIRWFGHIMVGAMAAGLPVTMASAAEVSGICPASAEAIDAAARAMLEQGMPGTTIAISQGGQAVFSRGYGLADVENNVPVTPDTVFELASVTKQFTAAAVLSLVQDGRIGLDDKLSLYVPDMPKAARITIYQLLVQTAGVHNFTDDAEGLRTKSVDRSPDDMLRWLAHLRPTLRFAPGSRWEYSNSNYVLLGLVAERVTGHSLQTVFADRLFKPAGLENTTLDLHEGAILHRARGYRHAPDEPLGQVAADWVSPTMTWAAGGLRTTADDLLKWTDALFHGRVIDAKSLAMMMRPGRLSDGRTVRQGMPSGRLPSLDSEYGMGLVISQTTYGLRYDHDGGIDGFKSWLAHFPDSDVTIAMLANSESVQLDSAALERAVFGQVAVGCIRAGSLSAR